jgi:hypothetical protein
MARSSLRSWRHTRIGGLPNQLDAATRRRAAYGLLIVNHFGVVASVAFAVIELRPTLVFLFLVALVVALLFGGRAAADPK